MHLCFLARTARVSPKKSIVFMCVCVCAWYVCVCVYTGPSVPLILDLNDPRMAFRSKNTGELANAGALLLPPAPKPKVKLGPPIDPNDEVRHCTCIHRRYEGCEARPMVSHSTQVP